MSKFSFTQKNVFLVSPEGWNYLFVSKHHYAIELAKKGNLVYFINPPVNHVPGGLCVKKSDLHENLFIVDYSLQFRGIRFLPRFLIRMIDNYFFKKLEKATGNRFDIVINFENSRFFDLGFAGKNVLKIYFQVDENQNYHPAVAAATADIVLAINNGILSAVSRFNKNSFLIPHSFQGNFSPLALRILSGEYKYKRPVSPLKIVYIGNLDNYYLDKDLFEEVVMANQNLEFLLVGPVNKSNDLYKRLSVYKHVRFTGKVSFKDIPGILDDADALLLVYNKNFNYSSHKLLEYLASGKTIISTYLSEYSHIPNLVNMCKSHSEFSDYFKSVISEIEINNALDRMQDRIRFAQDNTYFKKLEKIEELINIVQQDK